MADSLLTNQNIDNSTIIKNELENFTVNASTDENIIKDEKVYYHMDKNSLLTSTNIGTLSFSYNSDCNRIFYLENNFYLFLSYDRSSSPYKIAFTLLELRDDNILHSCSVVTKATSGISTFDDMFLIKQKENSYILQQCGNLFELTIQGTNLTVNNFIISSITGNQLYCTDLLHYIVVTYSSNTLDIYLYKSYTELDHVTISNLSLQNFGYILMYDNNYYSIILHHQWVKNDDTCRHFYIDLNNEKIILAGTQSTSIERCGSFYYDKEHNQYYLEGLGRNDSKSYYYGQRFRPNDYTHKIEYISWNKQGNFYGNIFYTDNNYVIAGDGSTTYLLDYSTELTDSLKSVSGQNLSQYCSSSAECPKLGGVIIPSSTNNKNFTFKLLKPKKASLIYYPKNAIAIEDSKNNQIKIITLE